jgi:hypothetical protein
MMPRNPKMSTNILKEEILQVITENFTEMLLDMINQNIQEALKQFQDTKSIGNKENIDKLELIQI